MDIVNLLHYLLALVFVLALVCAAMIVKRYGNNPAAFKAGLGGKLGNKLGKWSAPERRLAIVETLVLGPKQRVLILKRDNVEHLVLTGPEGSTVVETITPSGLRIASAATATSPFGADAQGGGGSVIEGGK